MPVLNHTATSYPTPKIGIAKPKVLIPVFPGTNCEYDSARAAKAAGIKPILGCEVYVAPGSRHDKLPGANNEDRYYHLVLLAENQKGYENLTKIVSKGFVEGYYYKPRIDMELLETYHEGIIALSACLAGEVQKHLLRGMYDEAKKTALRLESVFGKNNFFYRGSAFVWPTLPPRVDLISDHENEGCFRQSEKLRESARRV